MLGTFLIILENNTSGHTIESLLLPQEKMQPPTRWSHSVSHQLFLDFMFLTFKYFDGVVRIITMNHLLTYITITLSIDQKFKTSIMYTDKIVGASLIKI